MRIKVGFFTTIFLAMLVIAFVWPRYFYINIVGIGFSGFTLGTLALVVLSLGKLTMDHHARQVFFRGIGRALVPLMMLLVWFSWELITAFNGTYPDIALKTVLQATVFGHLWIILAAIFLSDDDALRLMPILTVACGFLVFAFGLVEFVSQKPLLDALGLTEFAAGDRAQLEAIAFASTDGFTLRIKSVFIHPIIFGQVMALLSPLGLHLVLNNLGVRRLFGVLLLVAAVASIILCQSRSPIIVMLAAMAVYLLMFFFDLRSRSRLSIVVGAAILGAFTLPVVVNTVLDVVVGENTRDQRSNKARVVQLAKATAALEYKPFLGYGAGTGAKIAGVEGRMNIRSLDSFYIKTAVETGYIGLTLFIVLQLSLIWFTARRALTAVSTTQRGLLSSGVGMLVGANLGLLIITSVDAYFFALLFVGYAIAYTGRLSAPAPARRTADYRARPVNGSLVAD